MILGSKQILLIWRGAHQMVIFKTNFLDMETTKYTMLEPSDVLLPLIQHDEKQ